MSESMFSGTRRYDNHDFRRLNIADEKSQHNIMILVGNGFDIATLQELKAPYRTDYQSFFYYLKSMHFNQENFIFKKMDELRHKHEVSLNVGGIGFPNWSDFEGLLQDLIHDEPRISSEIIRTDLREIQQKFSSFLDMVVSPELLNQLDEAARNNRWAYKTFAQFLADLDSVQYEHLSFPYDVDHYHLFNFSVVNFNYTSLLDNYLFLDQDQFMPHPYSGPDTNFQFRRNPRDHTYSQYLREAASASTGCSSYLMTNIYHPHGVQQIPRSLLFGIDADDTTASRGSSSSLAKAYWAQTPRRFKKMIHESELFIIFGSSLGKTDRWWWRHIVKTLSEGAELIIYQYSSSIDSGLETKKRISSDFVNQNYAPELFDYKDLDGDTFSQLIMNIRVVLYSDSESLSALGFGKDPYEPKDRDPSKIAPLR